MPRKRQDSYDASYLLNFRSGIPSDLPSTSYTPDYRGNANTKKSQKKLEAERQEARAREKMRSSFFLYASSSHAFVISRQQLQKQKQGRGMNMNMNQRPTSGSSSSSMNTKRDDKDTSSEADKAVAWESVRIVKSLSDANESSSTSNTSCAICLGEYIAPRITQCGHVFCYPCMLRHLHSSEGSSMGKCPCCYHWVQKHELRPVEFVTVQTPEVSTIMEFRKLYRHRGCNAPFIPYSNSNSNSNSTRRKTVTIEKRVISGDLPTATDQDACYSRTTYVDTDLYQQHLSNDISSLNIEMEDITLMYQNVTNTTVTASGEKDKYFLQSALQAVQHELELAVANAEEENRLRLEWDSMHHKHRIDVLPYKEHALENVCTDEGTEDGKTEVEAEVAPGTEHVEECQDTNATGQDTTNGTTNTDAGLTMKEKMTKKKKNASKEQKLEPGMMYMGGNCVQFYQATDGQLCFLSGFNLNCLSYEFSANDPGFRLVEDTASASGSPRRKQSQSQDHHQEMSLKPPFPDVIKGRVVDVERKHLTPDVRKRMGCFSHLPLYTDIILAELDIFNLSKETRRHFKKDIERRKNKRRAKREIEKKAEREARLKEEERIEDLKRGIQRIDPNDTFFHSMPVPTTDTNVFNQEDFVHTLALPNGDVHDSYTDTASGLSSSYTLQQRLKTEKKMSFSSACTSDNSFPSLDTSNSNAFPSLASASSSSSFPPLSSSSSPKPSSSPWKSTSTSTGNVSSSKMTSPSTQAPSSGTGSRRKKGKGKKTVLFSTGGRRSGY